MTFALHMSAFLPKRTGALSEVTASWNGAGPYHKRRIYLGTAPP